MVSVLKTANELGAEGETAVRAAYDIGEKTAIEVNGVARIPDGLLDNALSEVKNTKNLSYTRQLRDYNTFAQQTGRQFNLYVRPGARLSAPLEALRGNGFGGTINIVEIPFGH